MKKTMFDNIKSLRPYFFSLRELNGSNVSLDIKIPASWKFNEMLINEEPTVSIKVQDKNEKFNLLSLVSTATKEGYDMVFSSALTIIKTNLEDEEKIKLFNDKVDELKALFLSSPLDKLKGISFIKDQKNEKEHRITLDRKGNKEVTDGGKEKSGKDG